jgi:hypothetical protein
MNRVVKPAAPGVEGPLVNESSTNHPADGRPATAEPQLISLATWIASRYSAADAPCMNTVRRWVRNQNIEPAPEKQGRAYFFHPAARYVAGRAK